jgi:23S rRNA (cytidine1920-2'-O)/16S rRNA (cytidine1409-2'-O)-methyltransferase
MPANTPKKDRLDKLLFERGLVESREKAKALILAGNVLVNEQVVDNAGSVRKHDALGALKERMKYVSRGGLKLEHAFNKFTPDVKDAIVMDVGASTGGFTDCILQNGAVKVYAVDVGYGQFDLKLRNDNRVVLFEKTNIRHLERSAIKDRIDIAVIDVSSLHLLNRSLKSEERMSAKAEL